jgi:hypothetical protein
MGEAGRISTWMRNTIDQSFSNRIGDLGENDRDAARRLVYCHSHRGRSRENKIRFLRYQFSHIRTLQVGIGSRPAIFDVEVATLPPTQPLKFLSKCCDAGLDFGILLGERQYCTNTANSLRLLRLSC